MYNCVQVFYLDWCTCENLLPSILKFEGLFLILKNQATYSSKYGNPYYHIT